MGAQSCHERLLVRRIEAEQMLMQKSNDHRVAFRQILFAAVCHHWKVANLTFANNLNRNGRNYHEKAIVLFLRLSFICAGLSLSVFQGQSPSVQSDSSNAPTSKSEVRLTHLLAQAGPQRRFLNSS